MFTDLNETVTRKKLLEIHDCDGATFESESVLSLIERISTLITSGIDGAENGPTTDVLTSLGFGENDSVLQTISSILHKISCELNCKCSGGNIDMTTMEILKLLSSYDWDAKITIILACFAVEYARFSHVSTFYRNNHLGELVAALQQIPGNFDATFLGMKSNFASIIELSIKVTRFIAKFNNLPSKYISIEVEEMAFAMSQVPIAVYVITKSIVACAFQLTEVFGYTEMSSYRETIEFSGCEQKMISIHKVFEEQFNLCNIYVEEKKITNFIVKLKLKFDKTAVYSNNQKILQLLFNNKDCDLPLSIGIEKTKEVGVEILKGKTVLLLISDLEITDTEILVLRKIYDDSRKNRDCQYEIVWLPIVEDVIEQDDRFEQLKRMMPWYCLLHPRLLKAGVARFVREEWHYSKKSMLVAMDSRGKLVNPNAFQMVCTWGDLAYPFTQAREIDLYSRNSTWNLEILIGGIEPRVTTWIKHQKVICLYGGEDHTWIGEFITNIREIEEHVGIKLEMVYTGHTTSTEIVKVLGNHSHYWEAESTHHFWRRFELMGRTESYHGSRVSTTKETIVSEVNKINWVRQSKQGWALISHGAGIGAGKIALGKGDVILKALTEFEKWEVEAKHKGFVVALNAYLDGRHKIPDIHVCHECHRPM